MNLSGRYRKKESVARREIAGELFLIPVCGTPVDMENIFVLNPLAEFIWQRLDGEQTLQTIVADIVSDFEVEAGLAEADATDFIGKLLQNSLVEAVT